MKHLEELFIIIVNAQPSSLAMRFSILPLSIGFINY